MKKRYLVTTAIFLSTLLAAPVLAAENQYGATQPPAQTETQTEGVTTNVPQAQLDLMKKREEAKKRRDELLKLRQQNIETMDAGGTPVEKAPQQ
ncbi:hypothetical protein MJO47_10350 [Desulfuromonas sp. KJ2020]|uniref:hypothetical protein n=1 Tax=Desulfuromonas sp. KJ2020 TaxID=2919173 RepID=UPI000321ECC8|nr:hypothetical protein [Desulfuromonas sp. KJ2020]MCP3177501.1 hypothetical protein [Desulfuromonas sp. KJ2020]